jgi:formylmethanofuran dehydrogenase subunit E
MPESVPPQFEVQKTYPPRGGFQQYRLVTATGFKCSRCGKEKKAKLLAFAADKRDEPVCNGCYGEVLSKVS